VAGRRPRWFWTTCALALLLVAGGAVTAFVGYERTAGPDGAVRGYFAALRRADAGAALAFGDIPDGPRTLLTAKVLREQQRIAPIADVQVVVSQRHGGTATVAVHYDLDFPGDRLRVDDSVQVVRHGRDWHLARVAAYTRLDVLQAADRTSIVGAPVPADPTLVFPGAAPIRVDTAYLMVQDDSSVVTLSGGSDTAIAVGVSPAGAAAVRAALGTALRSCLAGLHPDPRCPLPSARTVPGSVRAALPANAVDALKIAVQPDSSGLVQVSGSLRLSGSYTDLDFDNVAHQHRGGFTLPVQAVSYATAPVALSWQQVAT
jgi:hypothetical protein